MTSLLELSLPDRAALRRLPVLLPVALDQTYDYLAPADADLPAGSFVLVPFGPQSRIGIIWDRDVGAGKAVDARKLKAIIAPLDVPALPPLSLRFAEWVARYTLSPLGMVVRMMMGAQAVFEPQKPRTGVRIVDGAPEPPRVTPARRRAMEIAADGLVRSKSALATEAVAAGTRAIKARRPNNYLDHQAQKTPRLPGF